MANECQISIIVLSFDDILVWLKNEWTPSLKSRLKPDPLGEPALWSPGSTKAAVLLMLLWYIVSRHFRQSQYSGCCWRASEPDALQKLSGWWAHAGQQEWKQLPLWALGRSAGDGFACREEENARLLDLNQHTVTYVSSLWRKQFSCVVFHRLFYKVKGYIQFTSTWV